jgi:hypothetical protein
MLWVLWIAVIAQSVKRWAMDWKIGVLGFDSWRGLGIFLFTTAFRTALEPTKPPIQWVPGVLSLGVKQPGREADNSLPHSVEAKEWVELYLHSPNAPSWSGAQLKHSDTFTSILLYLHLSCLFLCLPVYESTTRSDTNDMKLGYNVSPHCRNSWGIQIHKHRGNICDISLNSHHPRKWHDYRRENILFSSQIQHNCITRWKWHCITSVACKCEWCYVGTTGRQAGS